LGTRINNFIAGNTTINQEHLQKEIIQVISTDLSLVKPEIKQGLREALENLYSYCDVAFDKVINKQSILQPILKAINMVYQQEESFPLFASSRKVTAAPRNYQADTQEYIAQLPKNKQKSQVGTQGFTLGRSIEVSDPNSLGSKKRYKAIQESDQIADGNCGVGAIVYATQGQSEGVSIQATLTTMRESLAKNNCNFFKLNAAKERLLDKAKALQNLGNLSTASNCGGLIKQLQDECQTIAMYHESVSQNCDTLAKQIEDQTKSISDSELALASLRQSLPQNQNLSVDSVVEAQIISLEDALSESRVNLKQSQINLQNLTRERLLQTAKLRDIKMDLNVLHKVNELSVKDFQNGLSQSLNALTQENKEVRNEIKAIYQEIFRTPQRLGKWLEFQNDSRDVAQQATLAPVISEINSSPSIDQLADHLWEEILKLDLGVSSNSMLEDAQVVITYPAAAAADNKSLVLEQIQANYTQEFQAYEKSAKTNQRWLDRDEIVGQMLHQGYALVSSTDGGDARKTESVILTFRSLDDPSKYAYIANDNAATDSAGRGTHWFAVRPEPDIIPV